MFKVGDKIVYPMYGVGIIDQIEDGEQDIQGSYYLIRIPKGNLKIKVASNKTDVIGIRSVSEEWEIDAAMQTVAHTPIAIQNNWNARYKENLEKIRSGKLLDVLEVSRNLMLREKERGLSGAEKKMLTSSKQIVVSEVSYAKKIEEAEAEEYLAKTLLC